MNNKLALYNLKDRELTDKPGSVVDNHSSAIHVTMYLKQPTRIQLRAATTDSYLVLLRVGFTLPRSLPTTRCALTAPFHPYPSPMKVRIRAVYFLLHWPWVHTPQALPGTLPLGARTFLPSNKFKRRLPGGLSGGRIATLGLNYKALLPRYRLRHLASLVTCCS